jgi:hypothetical protein
VTPAKALRAQAEERAEAEYVPPHADWAKKGVGAQIFSQAGGLVGNTGTALTILPTTGTVTTYGANTITGGTY